MIAQEFSENLGGNIGFCLKATLEMIGPYFDPTEKGQVMPAVYAALLARW